MFQMSDHYLPYVQNTYIVVANTERVRILKANGRSIEENNILEVPKSTHTREHILYQDDASHDHDVKNREMLYKKLGEYLAHESIEDLILCVPEVYQQEIQSALPENVRSHISALVPKNLASLPIDAIIRILHEK